MSVVPAEFLEDPAIAVHMAVLGVIGGKLVDSEGRITEIAGSADLPFDVWFGLDKARREPGVTNTEPIVIKMDFPYVVMNGNVGLDSNRRLVGSSGRRSVFWTLTYVGTTLLQTLAVGGRLRDALADQRLVVEGRKSWLTSVEESPRVWRDDDAVQPNLRSLFYGVDQYAAGVTLTKTRGT